MPGIEVLRGVAASTVVVEHTWALTTEPRFWGYHIVEGLGEWGVVLFFIISGYILCDYFWKPRGQRSVPKFWMRRIFRIAPAYYVNVAILFLFFAPYAWVFSTSGAKQVASNLGFVHWMSPRTASSFNVNGALWTLTIEMTLYLVLPLIAPPMKKRPWLTFVAIFGFGMAFRAYTTYWGTGLIHYYFGRTYNDFGNAHLFIIRQFLGALPLFAFGMMARRLQLQWLQKKAASRRPSSDKPTRLPILLMLLVPSLLLLHWVEQGLNYIHPRLFIVYEPLLGLLMIPAVVYAARASNGRRSFPFRGSLWVGERSYSLYLWHFPIILAVFGRGPEVAPAHMSNAWFRVALVVLLSLIAAAVSYNAVEKPARLFGRRLADRWIPAARKPNGEPAPEVLKGRESSSGVSEPAGAAINGRFRATDKLK